MAGPLALCVALPALSSATLPITFSDPPIQVPWATGKTAFGHIKSTAGLADVLALGPGQTFFPNAQVWLNDGYGNFTAGASLQAYGGSAEGFTLADMNGDGYDDAILVSRSGLSIYLNNGTGDGSFSLSPITYLYGDASGYFPNTEDFQSIRVAAAKTSPNGHVAVAVTGAGSAGKHNLRVFPGNGDGTLAPPVNLIVGFSYPTPGPEFVDLDNNGAPAIVVPAVWGNQVVVFGNDGSGNFSLAFTLPALNQNYMQGGIQFIDMDHDSILDMVIVTADGNDNWSNSVKWYKGLGAASFETTAHTAWLGGSNPAQLWCNGTWIPNVFGRGLAAELNGDGDADLVLSNQVSQPAILANNGDGTFSLALSLSQTDSNNNPAFANYMSFLDVTGSGRKALIGSNDNNNSCQRYTPYGEFYGSPGSPPPPPVDCVVASEGFGECSVSCGGGTQTEILTIVTPPANGGDECRDPIVQSCNTQPCDSDGDGVIDDDDLCPGTPAGALVNLSGCSGAQWVARLCPASGAYKNHGAYVSCVSKAADQALASGLITDAEKDAIVSAAARSSVGKR